MFTARKKIVKEKGAEPDAFEESVAQVRICTVPIKLLPASGACLPLLRGRPGQLEGGGGAEGDQLTNSHCGLGCIGQFYVPSGYAGA